MKLPFDQVYLEVEKLYTKAFENNQEKEILEHCNFISDYIESCGWSVDEYMQEYIHRGVKEYLPPDCTGSN